ncbi:hypothetical protein IJG28_02160 [Candidatus Saccharibacteria bacterium]|nr:hypothetical protein [Candidatus Saccharibacteria bacterium]
MKKRGRVKIHKIKTWQLLIVLVVLLFVDATLLRMDHVRMTELRDAVLTADASEDDAAVETALNELKDFVFNNIVINVVDDNGAQKVMFGTGPFYLEHTYIRAANRALEEAEKNMTADSNPNGNVYQMASDVCRPQAIANGWSWNDAGYINCMTSEIQKYPAADELTSDIASSLPSTELYRKNYASPIFVFSLSGVMILITIIVALAIICRMFWWIILRLALFFV